MLIEFKIWNESGKRVTAIAIGDVAAVAFVAANATQHSIDVLCEIN